MTTDDNEVIAGLNALAAKAQSLRQSIESRQLRVVAEGGGPSYASYAAAVIEGRKRLSRFVPGSFFGDPAFDMLLDLYVAFERNEVRPMKCCVLSSRVPHATALRYLDLMEEAGLILRSEDPDDARRRLISLTPATAASVREWLAEISSIPLRRG